MTRQTRWKRKRREKKKKRRIRETQMTAEGGNGPFLVRSSGVDGGGCWGEAEEERSRR